MALHQVATEVVVASGMHAAFILGLAIVAVLVVADWAAFTRKASSALTCGMAIGRHHEHDELLIGLANERFGPAGERRSAHAGRFIAGKDRLVPQHVKGNAGFP